MMFGFDAQHTRLNPSEKTLNPGNVAALVQDWKVSIGQNADPNTRSSSPTVSNDVIYVGSTDGKLYAIDATTGQTRWTFTASGGPMHSSPAIADGKVYIGSDDSGLYAFNASGCNASMCSPMWIASTQAKILSSPTVVNGVVYIGSADHKLYAIDAFTGNIHWISLDMGNYINSSPIVANGVVYIGSFNSQIYAFNASTGDQLWSTTLSNAISSSPTVVNGVVYVVAQDGQLYAFHLPGTTS